MGKKERERERKKERKKKKRREHVIFYTPRNTKQGVRLSKLAKKRRKQKRNLKKKLFQRQKEKNEVSDLLRKEGISTRTHTQTFYIAKGIAKKEREKKLFFFFSD